MNINNAYMTGILGERKRVRDNAIVLVISVNHMSLSSKANPLIKIKSISFLIDCRSLFSKKLSMGHH